MPDDSRLPRKRRAHHRGARGPEHEKPEHQHPAAPRGSGGVDTEPSQWAAQVRLDYYERLDTTISSTTDVRRLVAGGVSCEPGEWVASVQARELVGRVSEGNPLPPEGLIQSGFAIKHSALQVVLTWSLGMGADNEQTIDIGASFVYSFHGMTPKISLRLPNGALVDKGPPTVVPPQPAPPAVLPYVDSLVFGAINKGKVWSARSIYQNTFTRAVPANEAGTIPVPLGCQYVEIFQRGTDVIPIPAYDYFTSGGQEICELGVEVGQRRTGRHRIPGNSGIIRSRAVADASLITAVFELEA